MFHTGLVCSILKRYLEKISTGFSGTSVRFVSTRPHEAGNFGKVGCV